VSETLSLPLCTSATHIPLNATALIYKTINSDQFSHLQTPILAIHKYQRLWKGKRWVMAELRRIDEEFPAAGLATYGIPPKQPEGPKLVKGQEAETLDREAAVSEPMALFSEPEMGDFRSQWSKLQTGFVDEPRRTVEGADKLVAAVMQRLADGFANERSGLEKQWDSGDNVSTEDLRVALQRYRSFFDRLLTL
jgi:hypothetical protein